MLFMNYSPIVIFVYNRPWHTRKAIEALQLNSQANESDLFIFSDAAKTLSENGKVNEVREYIKGVLGFKSITIIEREVNLGLAESIISGVTEIVNKYGRIIVLEDDIVTSVGFLKYMNNALSLYEYENSVGCIHAWNYNMNSTDYDETTFFLRGADCWGWATWKRAWDEFVPDGKRLLKIIENNKLEFDFNRRNTHQFVEMLSNQIQGINNSWAIRWHASLFIKNMYCLQPTNPIVKNIGLDNSGVHCGTWETVQNPVDYIDLTKINIEESEWFFSAFSKYFKNSTNSTPQWEKLRTLLKRLLHL